MGLFHCPLGAPYYDDDACIDCGLCYARLPEEKVAASRRIREYMKAHARQSSTAGKIAVCGKGGSGKTTVVALLALALREAGRRVIVIDADESNPGLARMLGLRGQPLPLEGLFGDGGAFRGSARFGLDDIPLAYVSARDGLHFLSVGKITDPFQGCACSMAESARQVVEGLEMKEGEVLLLDMEAGVESFGRGVERHADTVLAVVEPSFESITVAGRIAQMAGSMGIARVGAILNKMPSGEMASRTARELDRLEVKVLGELNFNSGLAESAFEGAPVDSRLALDEAAVIVAAL